MDNRVYDRIDEITKRILNGGEMSAEEGRWMIRLDQDYLSALMAGADRIRRTFRGSDVDACAIANVRSGNCSEDCSFCPQSGHFKTAAPVYDFIPAEEFAAQAERARSWGASDFSFVSKGWGVRSEKERRKIKEYVEAVQARTDIGRCASVGAINQETAHMLKAAGVENYHHNLECAESFFSEVCSTHSYQENIDAIRYAREAGLAVCSGGILGMGESLDQRVEFAETLRQLGVESVPLNFLNPIEGTPMQNVVPMAPREILQTIAVFRYLLPRAELRIAGGRHHLRDLQSMVFMAGASAIMIGNYLTTAGRGVEDDQQMLRDLGIAFRSETEKRRAAQTEAA